MSQFDYIKQTYGQEFHSGQRVVALGKSGVVIGADHHVHVRLDSGYPGRYHPSDVVPEPPQ